MNQGNWFIGFLLLAALAAACPVAAAVIGGAILLEVLIRRVLPAGVRTRRRWHGVPLQQRNLQRAAAGAFGLVVCVLLAANGFPVIGWQATAAIAGFALVYLVVGVHGSQGARFDAMAVFWWGVVVVGCAGLLFLIEGIRL